MHFDRFRATLDNAVAVRMVAEYRYIHQLLLTLMYQILKKYSFLKRCRSKTVTRLIKCK